MDNHVVFQQCWVTKVIRQPDRFWFRVGASEVVYTNAGRAVASTYREAWEQLVRTLEDVVHSAREAAELAERRWEAAYRHGPPLEPHQMDAFVDAMCEPSVVVGEVRSIPMKRKE